MKIKLFTRLRAASLIPLLLLPLFIVPTTGCTVSAAQIESDVNLVLQESGQVLIALGDAPQAAELQTAEVAVQAAEAAWKGGSPVADVISALNILEIAVSAVPLTSPYSAAVDAIIAGIEFVLNNLAPPPAATGAPRPLVMAAHVARVKNARVGRLVLKPHMFQSPVNAQKSLWNRSVEGTGLKKF